MGFGVKIQGGSSPTMNSERGVTPPPPSFPGSKSLFPNPQQQQQQEQEVKRRPLLDLSATAAGKKRRVGRGGYSLSR